MSKRILLTILFTCPLIYLSLNGQICNTPNSKTVEQQFQRIAKSRMNLAFKSRSSSTIDYIPVKVFNFNNSLTNQQVEDEIDELNSTFLSTNIQFIIYQDVKSYNETLNCSFNVCASNDLSCLSNYFILSEDNCLNLFFIGEQTSFAFMPSFGMPYEDMIFVQYNDIDANTVPHEFGHTFGLYHTHGKYNENVCSINLVDSLIEMGHTLDQVSLNYGNPSLLDCLEFGDNLCDTPAEPVNPNSNNCVWNNEHYNFDLDSSIINPQDPIGNYYDIIWNGNNISNIMSYGNPRSCLSSFTQDQINHMNTTNAISKNHLKNLFFSYIENTTSDITRCETVDYKFIASESVVGQNISIDRYDWNILDWVNLDTIIGVLGPDTFSYDAIDLINGQQLMLRITQGSESDTLQLGFVNENLCCDEITDLNNGLIAYYPFNGNANDESGNGHDADLIIASLTTDRFGESDKAYHFSNGVIRIPHHSDLNLSGDFSIALWSKWSGNITANQHLLTKGRDINVGSYFFRFFPSANHMQFVLRHANSSSTVVNNSTNFTEWHHLVTVVKSSIDSMYLFIDGKLVDASPSLDFTASNTYPLLLGAHQYSGYIFNYSGKIDDVRIYNRILNCNEIDSLNNEGCIQYKLIENQIFSMDTTFFARELIELDNVSVNSPFELTLKAPEVLIENNCQVDQGAKLKVINEDGCIQN